MGAAAVMVQVPVRRVAIVRLWTTGGVCIALGVLPRSLHSLRQALISALIQVV